MNKIRKVSQIMRVLFSIVFWLYPIFVVAIWMYISLYSATTIEVSKHSNLYLLSPGQKFWGLMITLLPTAIHMAIIYQLVRLFHLYGNGTIFEKQNAKCYRYIAIFLLVGQIIINPIYEMLLSIDFSHMHQISLNIDSTNIIAIVTGLVILIVSWIMEEASKLNEDQQLTI